MDQAYAILLLVHRSESKRLAEASPEDELQRLALI
jgi:hypothetical protein